MFEYQNKCIFGVVDFELNGIPFGSKSIGKLSPRSYSIRFDRKWKFSFVSVKVDGLLLTQRNYLINNKIN